MDPTLLWVGAVVTPASLLAFAFCTYGEWRDRYSMWESSHHNNPYVDGGRWCMAIYFSRTACLCMGLEVEIFDTDLRGGGGDFGVWLVGSALILHQTAKRIRTVAVRRRDAAPNAILPDSLNAARTDETR